jgi:hypothetical protein
MNERIQKLWAQAAFELNQEFFSFPDNWDELLREKFAELIVRECIQAIQNESMNSDDEWERGLVYAENGIKEHFGVK